MSIEVIAEIGMGTVEIPESGPAESVVLVVPIEPSMLLGDDYDVRVLRPSTLPAEDVEVTAQDSDTVTLTVTRPEGFAGTPGLTVHVLCTKQTNLDGGWVDASGLLDAGWTGNAKLRKFGDIVYFRFSLTATASIDGTPKTDGVTTITGLDPSYCGYALGVPTGFAIDDANQFIVALAPVAGSSEYVTVYGPSAAGDWTDGVSYIEGELSWVAGS